MPVSTSEPLRGAGDLVTLTPSTLQALNDCPLRWLAERHGGTDGRDLRSAIGSVLHALIAESDKSEPELLAGLERAWEHLPFDAQWHAANELARHRAMVAAFVEWRARSRGELTEVGVEVDVDGTLPTRRADGGGIRLRGRVDRLERDGAGRLVIVDVKTGKTPVSKDDAQQHAQLAMYQLAVAEGLSPASGWGPRSAGECPESQDDEPDHPCRHRLRFAGAGPRDDHQRARRRGNDRRLLGGGRENP